MKTGIQKFWCIDVKGSPFDDPDVRHDTGAPIDCRAGWVADDGTVMLFHTTTRENAESILANGPRENVCRIGFAGIEQPKAFWCSTIPLWFPYEQWMPHLDGADLKTLAVFVSQHVSSHRGWFNSTWPCVQYAIKACDVIRIARCDNPRRFRDPDAVAKLVAWEIECSQALKGGA